MVLRTCCVMGRHAISVLRLLLCFGAALLLLLPLNCETMLCTGPASVPAQQQLSHYACDGVAVAVAGQQDVVQQARMEHCATAHCAMKNCCGSCSMVHIACSHLIKKLVT
jgi:hypothetical protein